jgi:hypothetical protein
VASGAFLRAQTPQMTLTIENCGMTIAFSWCAAQIWPLVLFDWPPYGLLCGRSWYSLLPRKQETWGCLSRRLRWQKVVGVLWPRISSQKFSKLIEVRMPIVLCYVRRWMCVCLLINPPQSNTPGFKTAPNSQLFSRKSAASATIDPYLVPGMFEKRDCGRVGGGFHSASFHIHMREKTIVSTFLEDCLRYNLGAAALMGKSWFFRQCTSNFEYLLQDSHVLNLFESRAWDSNLQQVILDLRMCLFEVFSPCVQ